jgi:ABC-2 type transport system permease protein
MAKLTQIALNEYRRNVFKRSFLLALLGVPLLMALSLGVGFLMEALQNDDAPVGYVDLAGLFGDHPIAAPVSAGKPVEMIPFAAEAEARSALDSGRIQAYYVLSKSYRYTRHVELYYYRQPGGNASRQFYDFLQVNLMAGQPLERARRAAQLGEGLIVRSLDGRREVPGSPTFALMAPLLIGMAFVLLVLMSSGYLMQAVVEEKENRTMEVLVTSVSPSQLMGGKVLGIVAVSLTQLAVWALVAVAAVAAAGRLGIAWFQDTSLDWGIVAAALALALPSYVLTAALMAAAGATVTTAQESQSAGALFAVLNAAPLFLSWAIVMAPSGVLPAVLTFLPFTAMLTVVLRNLFSAVPAWQVAVAVAIQTAGAIAAIWLAGRAFRLGMLRFGQRLRLRELLAQES